MTTGHRGEAPVVTSLGHAGLRIQTEHLSLLCDPWLSPRGAFLGSWFQFPDNTHLAVPAVLDCDWVAVSHEHLDHLDLDLLARLPDRVRVVIPHYPSNALRRRLAAAGVTQRGRGARMGAAAAEPARRLAHRDPGTVPDVPRRRDPGRGERLRDHAHQRRPAERRTGATGDRGGRPSAGPDGRADVRGLLAPDQLRVPAGDQCADRCGQAALEVPRRGAAAAWGEAAHRDAVRGSAVLPRRTAATPQPADARAGRVPAPEPGVGVAARVPARAGVPLDAPRRHHQPG